MGAAIQSWAEGATRVMRPRAKTEDAEQRSKIAVGQTAMASVNMSMVHAGMLSAETR